MHNNYGMERLLLGYDFSVPPNAPRDCTKYTPQDLSNAHFLPIAL